LLLYIVVGHDIAVHNNNNKCILWLIIPGHIS